MVRLAEASVHAVQQGNDDDGHHTGDGDGKAAHGAGYFALFHDGRGADGVAGGSCSHALGDV